MRRVLTRVVVGLVVLGLAGGGLAWYFQQSGPPKAAFRTAPIKSGDLTATIGATGTVEPEEVVDIGAQVAGQIASFGKDEAGKSIDYGSVIAEDTVLAKIDDSLYAADVALSKASLGQAQAGLVNAKANVQQMTAKLIQAQADWDRAQKLGPSSEALAPTQYDAYKANFEIAKANVAVAEAGVTQAQAAINQAQATLDRSQRNLSYCTIKSPVKGVIIDRRVNIGQTVVASLSAPSLFLIAKDLTRIQVWVSVNEADIGSISPGMPVSFTVDAYPGRIFRGTVGKIRLNATMTQNVVTYTVEVTTDNADGKLLPYLTANVQFQTGHWKNVLLVPNAALRWSPSAEQVAPEFQSGLESGSRRGGRGDAGGGSAGGRSASSEPTTTRAATTQRVPAVRPTAGILWVQDGKWVRPIKVSVGPTDGTMTAVQGADLKEGIEVIIDEQRAGSGASKTANPFLPQIRPTRPQPSQ